jgi:glycosyltransferase involved in cell wall biosynthesis
MLTLIFAASLLIQAFFWIAFAIGYRRARDASLRALSSNENDSPQHPIGVSPENVSVIVAARNEAENIYHLIEALGRQTYSQFEVVVVDDGSIDETMSMLNSLATERTWLRIENVDEPVFPRKKRALMKGIAAAQNDLLLFTDADCRPGPAWLSEHVRLHTANKEPSIVVGHAVFDRSPGLVNTLARYISLLTSFQAGATIGLGVPFMAFGTNLSYRKKTFKSVGGYGDGLQSLSGDDDLFLQRVATYGAARILWMDSEKSIMRTTAQKTWRTWLQQKKRHNSAGRFFAPRVKFAGLFYWASMMGVVASAAMWSWIPIVAWCVVHALCIGNAFCFLKGKDLILRLPVLIPLYLVIQGILPVAGFFKPQKYWK